MALGESGDSPENLLLESPQKLVNHLLQFRFENDKNKCRSFLEECLTLIPSLKTSSTTSSTFEENSSSKNNKELLGEVIQNPSCNNQNENDSTSPPSPLIVSVSGMNPRGKHSLEFFTRGLLLTHSNSKSSVACERCRISRVILFPNPDDLRQKKKVVTLAVLLLFDGDHPLVLSSQKKPCHQICLQIPKEHTVFVRDQFQKIWGDTYDPGNIISVPFSTTTRSRNSADISFLSEQGKVPFIQCYHGVNMGSLFPLKEGLLFFKPPLFLLRDDIHSIACGRGGSGSTRYVDLHVTLTNNKESNDDSGNNTVVEFSNIQREELGPLNNYIQALANDDETIETKENQMTTKENIDEHNANTSNRFGRPRRKAAVEASKATALEIMKGGLDHRKQDDDDDDDDDEEDNNDDDDRIEDRDEDSECLSSDYEEDNLCANDEQDEDDRINDIDDEETESEVEEEENCGKMVKRQRTS